MSAQRRDEAPLARAHLAAALALLLAGVAWLALRGVTPWTLQRAAALVALGAFSVLIFGTSRLLLAGMAGRPIAGPAWLGWAPLALGAAGAIGAFYASSLPEAAALVLASLWSAAALVHVAVVVATVRRPRTTRPRSPLPGGPSRATDRLVAVLNAGSLAYAAAAAAAVPLAHAGRYPMAAALHLLLPGFVTLTIAGVAGHALPRFLGRPFPVPLLAAGAPLAVAGPGLIAWGLGGRAWAFRAGAAAEAAALALLAAAVLTMLATSPRRRASHAAYAGGCVSILAGATLGLLFALRPETLRWIPAHGLLTLLGFVGLFVVGASLDLYGPALRAGAAAFRRHARAVVSLSVSGVALATAGALAEAPAVARAGLALYAAAIALHLAGAVAADARARRVVRRQATLATREAR